MRCRSSVSSPFVFLSLVVLLSGCPSASVDAREDARAVLDAAVDAALDGAVAAEAGAPDAAADTGPFDDAALPEADASPLADASPGDDAAEPASDAAPPQGDAGDPVDVTPPDTTLIAGPAALIATATAAIEFSSSEPLSLFECATDRAALTPCTSPLELILTEGAHRVEIVAIDAAGNRDPSPLVVELTVDLTAPTVTILTGPSGDVTARDVSFTFTATAAAARFECALDAAAAQPCTSPRAYTALALGPHTFTVVAYDAAGNASTPITRRFQVLAVTPDTVIVAGPPPLGNVPMVSFELESDVPGARFECRVGAAPFAACAAIAMVTVSEGRHRFEARAVNVTVADPTPALYDFIVDLTPPAATIVAPASGATTPRNVSMTYTAEAGSTVRCAIDGAALAPCSPSPVAYTNLAHGFHQLHLIATDAAGNSSAEVLRNFDVDAMGPSIAIQPLAGNVATASGRIGFSIGEPVTVACTLDGVAAACTATGIDFVGLAVGSHTLVVRATDALGNVGPPSTYVFRVAVDTVVTVLNRGCSQGLPATVFVNAPDGTLRGEVSGSVVTTNLIQDGDSVTAAYTDSDTRLETVFGVRAGQALSVGDGMFECGGGGAAPGFTVRIPAPLAGANYYEVRYGLCTRRFTAGEIGQNIAIAPGAVCRGASGNYTLVARASNSSSGLYQQAYLTNVAPGSSVVMPAWSARQPIPTTFVNFPAGVFTLDAEISPYLDGVEVTTAQSRAAPTNPVAQPAFGAGLGTTYRVFGEARLDSPNTQMFTGRGFEVPAAPAVTVDLATALPIIRSMAVDRTNQSRPVVTYVSDAPIVADGGLAVLEWTTPTRGRWNFVFPSTMTQIRAPALPASVSGWLPTAASVYNLRMEHADVTALVGWEAFRPVYRRYLDGLPEGSSGFNSGTGLADVRMTTMTYYAP